MSLLPLRIALVVVLGTVACSGARVARDPAAETVSRDLLARYPLREVAGTGAELDRLVRLRTWVHGRWQHDGLNEPERFDSRAILQAAATGQRFRCVEYSFVLADVYLALGWPARVARVQGNGAHVVTEVFARSLQRWVMMDGQFGVHVVRDGVLLDTAAVQRALRAGEAATLTVAGADDAAGYLGFFQNYLTYTMVSAQAAVGRHLDELLVLAPAGDAGPSARPPYLQRLGSRYVVTHDAAELYGVPPDAGEALP